jgi:hypothetical protein
LKPFILGVSLWKYFTSNISFSNPGSFLGLRAGFVVDSHPAYWMRLWLGLGVAKFSR